MPDIKYVWPKGELEKINQRNVGKVARAATDAMRDVAALAKSGAQAAIASGGRFGDRLTQGVTARTYPTKGASLKPVAFIGHKINFAVVFQRGSRIAGKPLLWIPLSGTIAAKQHIPAGKFPGGLRSVARRRGRPLLISKVSGTPQYFGISAVKLRKRFDFRAACERAARLFGTLYHSHLKD